jgi:GntR family transcriptional repressor for pyruvate dehydrogenase complex
MAAGKTAERLLFDLVHDIAADGLRAGDRLPSQPELMRRHGVGPTPLREALRMLELAGLVSVRPGPNAGAIVETANAEHLAALVAPFLCLAGVTYGQVMDAWAATEPLLSAAAAANPDRAAVRAELAAFAAEPDSEEPVGSAHAIDFHDAVARAAGNPALVLAAQVLSYVAADLYWANTGAVLPGGGVRRDHRAVAEAILAGDAASARSAMEAHIRSAADAVLARIGCSRDAPFVWARRRAGQAAYRQRPLARGSVSGGSTK